MNDNIDVSFNKILTHWEKIRDFNRNVFTYRNNQIAYNKIKDQIKKLPISNQHPNEDLNSTTESNLFQIVSILDTHLPVRKHDQVTLIPPIAVINLVMSRLTYGDHQHYGYAERLFKLAETHDLTTTYTCSDFIKHIWYRNKDNYFETISKVFNYAISKKFNLTDDSYLLIIKSAKNEMDSQLALKALAQIKKYYKTLSDDLELIIQYFTMLIEFFVENKNYSAVGEIINFIKKDEKLSSQKNYIGIYNAALIAYCHHDYLEAKKFFLEKIMDKDNPEILSKIDHEAVYTLLKVLFKNNHLESAQEIVINMREKNIYIPDIYLCSLTIEYQIKNKNFKQAKENYYSLVKTLTNQDPKHISHIYNLLLEGACLNNDPKFISELILDIKQEKAFEPQSVFYDETINTLINFAVKNNYDELIQHIQTVSFKLNKAQISLLDAYQKEKRKNKMDNSTFSTSSNTIPTSTKKTDAKITTTTTLTSTTATTTITTTTTAQPTTILASIKNNPDSKSIDNFFKLIKSGNYEKILKFNNKEDYVNLTDSEGKTALHHVINLNFQHAFKIQIFDLLINLGANVNHTDSNNISPLKTLILFNTGHSQKNILDSYYLLDILLQNDANPNVQDNNNETFLHRAIENNDAYMAKLLIDCRINLEIKNKNGLTALHQAAAYGKTELFKILLQNKASLETMTNNNLTAYDLASINNHQAICELINQYTHNLEFFISYWSQSNNFTGNKIIIDRDKNYLIYEEKLSKANSIKELEIIIKDLEEVKNLSPNTTVLNILIDKTGNSFNRYDLSKKLFFNINDLKLQTDSRSFELIINLAIKNNDLNFLEEKIIPDLKVSLSTETSKKLIKFLKENNKTKLANQLQDFINRNKKTQSNKNINPEKKFTILKREERQTKSPILIPAPAPTPIPTKTTTTSLNTTTTTATTTSTGRAKSTTSTPSTPPKIINDIRIELIPGTIVKIDQEELLINSIESLINYWEKQEINQKNIFDENKSTYQNCAIKIEKASNLDEILIIIKSDLINKKLIPNNIIVNTLLSKTIQLQSDHFELQEIIYKFALKTKLIDSDIFKLIILSAINNKFYVKAITIYQTMASNNYPVDPSIKTKIIMAYCETNNSTDIRHIKKLYSEIISSKINIDQVENIISKLLIFTSKFLNQDQFAREIYQEIQNKKIILSTEQYQLIFSNILIELNKIKPEKNRAWINLLITMLKDINQNNNINLDSKIYYDLIEYCCDIKEFKSALEIFSISKINLGLQDETQFPYWLSYIKIIDNIKKIIQHAIETHQDIEVNPLELQLKTNPKLSLENLINDINNFNQSEFTVDIEDNKIKINVTNKKLFKKNIQPASKTNPDKIKNKILEEEVTEQTNTPMPKELADNLLAVLDSKKPEVITTATTTTTIIPAIIPVFETKTIQKSSVALIGYDKKIGLIFTYFDKETAIKVLRSNTECYTIFQDLIYINVVRLDNNKIIFNNNKSESYQKFSDIFGVYEQSQDPNDKSYTLTIVVKAGEYSKNLIHLLNYLSATAHKNSKIETNPKIFSSTFPIQEGEYLYDVPCEYIEVSNIIPEAIIKFDLKNKSGWQNKFTTFWANDYNPDAQTKQKEDHINKTKNLITQCKNFIENYAQHVYLYTPNIDKDERFKETIFKLSNRLNANISKENIMLKAREKIESYTKDAHDYFKNSHYLEAAEKFFGCLPTALLHIHFSDPMLSSAHYNLGRCLQYLHLEDDSKMNLQLTDLSQFFLEKSYDLRKKYCESQSPQLDFEKDELKIKLDIALKKHSSLIPSPSCNN